MKDDTQGYAYDPSRRPICSVAPDGRLVIDSNSPEADLEGILVNLRLKQVQGEWEGDPEGKSKRLLYTLGMFARVYCANRLNAVACTLLAPTAFGCQGTSPMVLDLAFQLMEEGKGEFLGFAAQEIPDSVRSHQNLRDHLNIPRMPTVACIVLRDSFGAQASAVYLSGALYEIYCFDGPGGRPLGDEHLSRLKDFSL